MSRGTRALPVAGVLSAAGGIVAALLIAAALLMAGPLPGRGASAQPQAAGDEEWRELLRRAREAADEWSWSGEVLMATWEGGEPAVSILDVSHGAGGALVLAAEQDFTMRLGDAGGQLVDHDEGWLMPLPASAASSAASRLVRKYIVRVVGGDQTLTRPATRLEIYRRDDGSLRERLWVDDATGLLLRRETYDGAERRLRLAAYLSLELGVSEGSAGDESDPVGDEMALARPGGSGRDAGLRERAHGAMTVGVDGLTTLEAAGWSVPPELPGGYRAIGGYVVSGERSQPLHLVYSDGLYSVSLFQQRGDADWDSLPGGAARAEGLDWHAYEWPGAVPRRLAWEAQGSTFVLVGDAPPVEFVRIAEALPHPAAPGLLQRVARGVGRLWSWVAPWD